ncbi:MAG: hemolysin family protein [bacterium]|nr:hemolysin family protein [bacterium]
MDNNLILQLSFLVILLGLSAFFSGAEATLFALSKLKIKQLRTTCQTKILNLIENPAKLLSTLLIGTTLVNITASALGTFIIINLCAGIGLNEILSTTLAIFVMTSLILLFGEIIPITFGVTKSMQFAPLVVHPVKWFTILLAPLRIGLSWLTISIVSLIEKHRFFVRDKELTEEEIRTMIDIGAKEGVLKAQEQELIHSIFEFGDMKVEEVMIPQTRMVSANIKEDSEAKILHLMSRQGHSRLPVISLTDQTSQSFKEEDIVGIIHVKNFLLAIKNQTDWQKLIMPAYFVLPSMKINALLKEFQKSHLQMAIVKNKLGRVVGLVTMEDLLEEIVGEIHDEYPQERIKN